MITTIKEEQQNTEVFLAKREGGDPIKAKEWKQVHLNLRLYNLVSTYKDRELDAFVRGIAVNMCNLRNSRRGQHQETKRMFPSGTDISVADTQVISNCTVNQVPGTSTSFAPQYSTPSVVNRKTKGTHSSQNKRKKLLIVHIIGVNYKVYCLYIDDNKISVFH
jgi:hypothetical protein